MLQIDEEEFKHLFIDLGLTAQEILIEAFLESGKDPTDIASYFGCSPQAIRKQHIRAAIKKGVEFEEESTQVDDS